MSIYEINKMRQVCKLAAEMLCFLQSKIKIGITTEELDEYAVNWANSHNVINAPLGYHGFPKSICTSVNQVVCHGIPNKNTILKSEDIINIDVTLILDGYHGDTSKTFYVNKINSHIKKLIQTTKECLNLGINQVYPNNKIGDIGYAIQNHAENNKFSVVQDFVGHGIGKNFHSDPQIPHFGKKNTGLSLSQNMIFTIEPMINVGTHKTKILDDGWTVETLDKKLSAQFEHTILVTNNGYEILTDIN